MGAERKERQLLFLPQTESNLKEEKERQNEYETIKSERHDYQNRSRSKKNGKRSQREKISQSEDM